MIRAVLSAVLFATLFGAVHVPTRASAEDTRLYTVRYDADQVVRVPGRQGFQSMIEFAPAERIENVAIGDSAAWQVTPNKRANMLFVKPMVPNARTNMTVVTDKRTYLFDLVSAPAKAEPTYVVRFTYPAEAAPLPPEPTASVLQAAAAAETPLQYNFGWTAKGDRSLFPARTYDDGITTYLSWRRNAELPAILTPGPGGAEGPVNFAARDDTIEIDQVPAVLVLRAGGKRAVLTRTLPVPGSARARPRTRVAER